MLRTAGTLVTVAGIIVQSSSALACRQPAYGADLKDLQNIRADQIAIYGIEEESYKAAKPLCASMGCERVVRFRVREVVSGPAKEGQVYFIWDRFMCGVIFPKKDGMTFVVLERTPEGPFEAITIRKIKEQIAK